MQHVKLFEEVKVVYSFDELSPEAQRKVLDDYRDINVEHTNWWEDEIEHQQDLLREQGLPDADIQFSGFYSQGDGASFTASVDRVNVFLKTIGMPELPQEVEECFSISVRRVQSNYVHERSVSLDVEIECDEDVIETHPFGFEVPFEWRLKELAEEIEERGGEWLEQRCRQIYRALEDEWDGLQSDESVEDTLMANDYRFNAEGHTV